MVIETVQPENTFATGGFVKDHVGVDRSQVFALALTSVAIGLADSFALTRLMQSLLYDVSASDPLTFAGVAALLTIVALLACYLPARPAMKVDPLVVLRYE